jgi:hypothetical protein
MRVLTQRAWQPYGGAVGGSVLRFLFGTLKYIMVNAWRGLESDQMCWCSLVLAFPAVIEQGSLACTPHGSSAELVGKRTQKYIDGRLTVPLAGSPTRSRRGVEAAREWSAVTNARLAGR